VKPPITIRRLREDEVGAIRALRLRALQTDPIAFGSSYAQEHAFPEETWSERTIAGATSLTQSTWVAEAPGGELVGSVTILRTEGRFGVFGMWVDPGHRGRGLGRQLLKTALQWAQERGPMLPLWLDVNPKQAAAVHLYEDLGFRRTGKSKTLEHTEGEIAVEMVRSPGE
jgi:ribosomal protein S18 acetylase RimI-like enzyme